MKTTTRYDKVIKGSENYIHVEEFVLALTSPVERGTKGENAALRRLLQGFSDEEKNWRSVLDPLAVSCDAWINRCQKHRLNNVLPDQDQQLLYYEKTIYQQATGAQVVQYIDHVIHLVETLKFIARWNKRENDQGTKKWKTTLIRDSFCASSPQNDELWTTLSKKPKNQCQALKSAMKTFSSDHARRITTYNNLANVYKMFGPGIFLDLFWAPETPKSKTFRPFLEYLRQNMPVSENLKLSVYNYGRSADSLYCILEVLAGTEIAIFVQDFMKEYPPYLPRGSPEFTWGRDV
ncbi:hypothetical protein CPB85DRAFT_644621 [Mucidula mucida]|nr:hypothetical protein CPB85DRAFT_644621 [Mucidula mucida]